MVIRHLIHHNPRVLRQSGQPWLTAPLAQEFMGHLAVIIARFPWTFPPQLGGGYPAVLRPRMPNNEPRAFPWGFLHPRPLFLPVPDTIIARVFIHRGRLSRHCRTPSLVALTIPPFFTEVPVVSCSDRGFFLQRLGARPFAKRQTPAVERTATGADTAMGGTAFRLQIRSQPRQRERRALAVRLTPSLPRSCWESIGKHAGRASAAYRFFLHQPRWTALRGRHDAFHGCAPHASSRRGALSTGACLLTHVAFGAVNIILHQYERSFALRPERTPWCRHTSRSQICVFRSHYNTRFCQKYQVM